MTEWDRPQAGENTPPVIVASSVQGFDPPDAQCLVAKMPPTLFFSIDILDLDNPEALEVFWFEAHQDRGKVLQDPQRFLPPGDSADERRSTHSFSGAPGVDGAWKITASACDGAHGFSPLFSCENDPYEAETFWYLCLYETEPTECDWSCPP